MYLDHFGLRTTPFSLTFEPTSYYEACHQDAANDLRYSIGERKGLATLIGQPGTGKTTLLNNLRKSFDANVRGFLVSDVSLGAGSVLKQLMTELGLPPLDRETLPLVLRSYLQNWLLLGKTLVLLVDEAQSLTAEQLEEIRYLTNLELEGRKLIEIILAAQPSLETRLAAPQFEALRQRIAVRTYLEPLEIEQTSSYVQWRLQAAGTDDPGLFDSEAVGAVHRRSRGIPRLINLICDRALLLAYAEDSPGVEASIVDRAANELGIDHGVSSSSREPVSRDTGEDWTPPDTGDVIVRLFAIEKKLDVILQAMALAGLLSAEDDDDPERQVAKLSRPPGAPS